MKSVLSLFSVAACLLGATSLLQAQVGIGFQAGYLSSKARIQETSNNGDDDISDAVAGYVIGIPLELSIAKAVAIQPEVNFLRTGYSTASAGNNFLETFYNVLEVPVLLKVGYISENFSLAATAGPSFQYTMSGQVKGSLLGQTIDQKIDFDDFGSEDINRSNFFGLAGVQLGVPIGIGKIVVDGRYRFQLNDGDGSEDFEIRGRGLSATAGIIFTLGDY